MFTPLIYPAAGDARNPTTAAISWGSPILFAGISSIISSFSSSKLFPVFSALPLSTDSSRRVIVAPGRTLFTVIPNGPNSFANVLDQLATAPRTELDTPSPWIGIFTDVEIMFMILPYFCFHSRNERLGQNMITQQVFGKPSHIPRACIDCQSCGWTTRVVHEYFDYMRRNVLFNFFYSLGKSKSAAI